MFVISEDASGNLEHSSAALKDNLKTWLNSIRMVNDSLDILDASIINLGIEFDFIAKQDANKHATFNLAKDELYKELNEIKPEIGEPFQITEIFRILKEVPEILDVVNIKITSKSTTAHSSVSYAITENLSPEGRTLYIPQDSIWEIKFKSDITGTVK